MSDPSSPSAHLLFRQKSTRRSLHAYIYALAGRPPSKTSGANAGDGDIFLAEPVSICESRRGRVICLSQMDPQGVRRSCLVTVTAGMLRFSPVIRMESRSVVPKAWRCEAGDLQQGGQVDQGGLTGSEPLNHSFAPTQLARPLLHTDPIFSAYISVLPAFPFCPHNGISFSDTNLKSSFNSAG